MRGGSQVLLPLDLHGGVEEHWKRSDKAPRPCIESCSKKAVDKVKTSWSVMGFHPCRVVTSRILPGLLLLSRGQHFYRNYNYTNNILGYQVFGRWGISMLSPMAANARAASRRTHGWGELTREYSCGLASLLGNLAKTLQAYS